MNYNSIYYSTTNRYKWDNIFKKVFKKGPSKICERQAVFQMFYQANIRKTKYINSS